MISFIRDSIRPVLLGAVRLWLVSEYSENGQIPQWVAYHVYPRDIEWGPGGLKGKRIRVEFTLEDEP